MHGRKVNCIVYAKSEGNLLFLLLKTTQRRGGFWQGVTGKVEESETYLEGAGRELLEETGIDIRAASQVYENTFSFTFKDRSGEEVEEHVFGIGFSTLPDVDLDHNVYEEHTSFEWVPYDAVPSRLRFDEEKRAFSSVAERIRETGE